MKGKSKYLFIAALVSVFLLGALPFVFAGSEGGEGQIVLHFWTMQQSDKRVVENQNSVIAEFERLNPNIKIELEVTPYAAYRDKVLVAAKGGNPPDICVVDHIWHSEFAAAGFIISVDNYLKLSPIKSEQFFPGAWDSVSYQGKVWGIPMDVGQWEVLYYNKDIFKKAGVSVPKTWDEWLSVGKKLTKDTTGDGKVDQWGYYLLGAKDEGTICFIDSLLQSNGGKIVSDDGKRGMLDSPEVIEAMEFYKKLVGIAPPGVPSGDQVGSSNYFTTGKVAMEGIGEWEQDTIRNRAPKMDWGVATMPAPAGKVFHPCLGGWSYVIFKGSRYQDAAWKFIEFASSEANNYKMAALTPANVNAAPKFLNEFKVGPSVIFKHFEQGYPRPKVPVYPQISEIQRQMVQEILMGKNVRQACIDANKEVNDLLAGK
jgi:ABC-type glycerol-3-phosphate transport system substrate-binding protein